MRHFLRLADADPLGVRPLLERARAYREGHARADFHGRILGLLFLAPSLRTRVSFECALHRAGGHALTLDAARGLWPLETRRGVRMDGTAVEHVDDAVGVLGRYVDALAVRAFAHLENDRDDHRDELFSALRERSPIPLVSMESGREHPCQALADVLTIERHHGSLAGRSVLLRWVPHVKPLPKAVANSFLLTAACLGARVTVAAPAEFDLEEGVWEEAQTYAAASGGAVVRCHERAIPPETVAVVAKSWGPHGAPQTLWRVGAHDDWRLGPRDFAAVPEASLLHCLPVRRNVEIEDALLDGPQSLILEEAADRLWVQQAVLAALWDSEERALP